MLSKEEILGAKDIITKLVKVPEWHGDVLVKRMSGIERDAFEQSIIERDGEDTKVNLSNIRAKLCAKTIVDDKGVLVFSDADLIELGKKSAIALDRVYSVAQKINHLGKDDIDELIKNSEGSQSEDSNSG